MGRSVVHVDVLKAQLTKLGVGSNASCDGTCISLAALPDMAGTKENSRQICSRNTVSPHTESSELQAPSLSTL